MRMHAGLLTSVVLVTACGASAGPVALQSPTPSASTAALSPSPSGAGPSPSPEAPSPIPSPSPMPSPSPVPQVACHGGAGLGAIVLMEGYQQELLYDVSDARRPRLL